jgi:hypothetical protein
LSAWMCEQLWMFSWILRFCIPLVFQHYAVFNIILFTTASNLSQVLLLLNQCKKSIIWESNYNLWTSQNVEQKWYVFERHCWWRAAAGVKIEEEKTIEIKNYDILPKKHKCIDISFLSSRNICSLKITTYTINLFWSGNTVTLELGYLFDPKARCVHVSLLCFLIIFHYVMLNLVIYLMTLSLTQDYLKLNE